MEESLILSSKRQGIFQGKLLFCVSCGILPRWYVCGCVGVCNWVGTCIDCKCCPDIVAANPAPHSLLGGTNHVNSKQSIIDECSICI